MPVCSRFTVLQILLGKDSPCLKINLIGEDSPIPKFMHLKIRRRDGVKSLMTFKEDEFKVLINGCIKT